MEAGCIRHIGRHIGHITIRARIACRIHDQRSLIDYRFSISDMDSIVIQRIITSCQFIRSTSSACYSTFGFRVRCRIASIGIAEEFISQYGRLSIPIHQPAFFLINGVGILIRVKGRAIGSGYITYGQIQVSRFYGNGAAAGDRIVGGSIVAVAGFYSCTRRQILVFIGACMGRGVAALAGGIGAIGGNGIGDIADVQGIPVHQLSAVVLRRPAGHMSIAVGLRSISIDGQSLPCNFHFSRVSSLIIAIQGLDTILIGHIHHIESSVLVISCLVCLCTIDFFISLCPDSCIFRPFAGYVDRREPLLGAVRTDHII